MNWVLDADIQGFLDTLNHDWLLRFVEHRVGDKRITRLIRKWLKAGGVEDGVRTASEQGTPQGGSISPLLANIYLRGHVRYLGVPGNGPRITAFRFAIGRLWHRALRRRSQNDRTSWERAARLIDLYLPKARICHPYPNQRLRVTTRGRSPVR